MIVKSAIVKQRVRKTPKSFSWVDHRLVRERYIDQLTHVQAALYLFLVCVADDKGLSYYGDKSITKHLSMDQNTLNEARAALIRIGLIAWQKPLYQVLSLDRSERQLTGSRSNMENALSLGDILKMAGEGKS